MNDYVRIADPRKVFDKGYEPSYSTAIYYVSKVQNTEPPTYKVTNLHTKQELDKGFYEQELQRTKYPNDFLIQKILKRRGDKLYVKWLGFDRPQWINKSDIV